VSSVFAGLAEGTAAAMAPPCGDKKKGKPDLRPERKQFKKHRKEAVAEQGDDGEQQQQPSSAALLAAAADGADFPRGTAASHPLFSCDSVSVHFFTSSSFGVLCRRAQPPEQGRGGGSPRRGRGRLR
jgi:hypothetical protein